VAVNQGKTLLDTTTALSFSKDTKKALTLTSTLRDVTSARDSGSNYTLSMSLTHPHTDLDVRMDSHIAASNDRYSAAVDTWYLTSRRERKNLALRGEIDQLRRQISMEMVSPMKKMAVKGQVQSTEPLSLSLTNSVDDKTPVSADLTLDTAKRSFYVKANYDAARPDRAVVMKAYYVNDTAFEAKLYRAMENDVITDALMAVRLNTSTLLHSRLHWRPATLAEIKESAVRSLVEAAVHTKAAARTLNQAVRQEVTERYARSTASLAEDLRPTMELLDAEIQALGDAFQHQINNLRRKLARAYRNSPYMQQMRDSYVAVERQLAELSYSYQQRMKAVGEAVRTSLEDMSRYPVGEKYQEAVDHVLQGFEEYVDSSTASLTDAVMAIDSCLMKLHKHTSRMSTYVTEAAHNATSHPTLVYLKNSLDLTPYIETAANKIGSLRMPQQLTDAIYSASARMNEVMADKNLAALAHVRKAYNEVYQQGVWAYNYWEVEENLRKHLLSIAELVKEIVKEEVQMYTRHFRFLQKSHVTVWSPEQGEVQAELHLPVAMETLTSMPDVTPLVDRYNHVVDTVVPSRDTVQYFYDNYVPKKSWWSDNSTAAEKPDVVAELDEFTPKSPRRLYKRKYNKRPAVAAM